MKKKGVEMSLNVIIIAAIGLLILVILSFLVINYVAKVRGGTESCTVKGGTCQATCAGDTADNTDCSGSRPICCKVISTS